MSDIPENDSVAFTVAGESILLCRTGGRVFAIANQCSHAHAALQGGRVRPCYIICPLHGARFDLRDGSPKGDLTRLSIRTYGLTVEDDWVKVAVAE